jgi:hypothetical protein
VRLFNYAIGVLAIINLVMFLVTGCLIGEPRETPVYTFWDAVTYLASGAICLAFFCCLREFRRFLDDN